MGWPYSQRCSQHYRPGETPMATEIQVTTREAAHALGVSLRTAQRRAKQGKLQATKTGGRWAITLVADLGGWKPWQIDKARELIEQGGIRPARRTGLYLAVSLDGTSKRLVHRAACDCPA